MWTAGSTATPNGLFPTLMVAVTFGAAAGVADCAGDCDCVDVFVVP